MIYFWIKLAHILSVVLFIGNIITGIFWKNVADRTNKPNIQAFAMAGIIRSDAIFTIPSVIAILVTGVLLAMQGGFPIFGTRWISWSLIAFALSGLLFGAYLAPAQKRLLRMAQEGGEPWPSADYRKLSLRWELVGLVAILLPLIALALMVLKPSL